MFYTYTDTVDVPRIVPYVTINSNTISVNRTNVTLTLNWGEPFNNLDPIVSYTVSCSGDVTCPPNFTTTDNTTRSYTITNLTTMTTYTFSVVATNSIGSGEAGVVMITTPPGENINNNKRLQLINTQYFNMYAMHYIILICIVTCLQWQCSCFHTKLCIHYAKQNHLVYKHVRPTKSFDV